MKYIRQAWPEYKNVEFNEDKARHYYNRTSYTGAEARYKIFCTLHDTEVPPDEFFKAEIEYEAEYSRRNLPVTTYLYRSYCKNGVLLYTGITSCIYRRMQQHKSGAEWFEEMESFTSEAYPTNLAARQHEEAVILIERPIYNIVSANSAYTNLNFHEKHRSGIDFSIYAFSSEGKIEKIPESRVMWKCPKQSKNTIATVKKR